MASQMWFGIPGKKLQFVPCPLIGSTITRRRFAERVQFQNGGGNASCSNQYQLEYNFSFSGPAHELDGIDAFNRFGQGYYGDDLLYLAHPGHFETNLFSAPWATPAIIENGWKNTQVPVPTFLPTSITAYNQPATYAKWTITADANTYTKKFTIVIPPTHTLYLGASGVATGTAVVRIQPINVNYTAAATQDLTLLAQAGSTRMNKTLSGATYSSVDVYITRTSAADSTMSITSMMAQLYLTGTSPILPTNHYQGEGASGLMFVDDAIVESYSYMFPPRKGISTTMVEVEAWR